jgi:hypothetical protein
MPSSLFGRRNSYAGVPGVGPCRAWIEVKLAADGAGMNCCNSASLSRRAAAAGATAERKDMRL